MKKYRLILLLAAILTLEVFACSTPRNSLKPDEPIHTFQEFPADRFYAETEEHVGKVFEDRFKFYRLYHGEESAPPAKGEQTVRGKTHFTARLITQYTQVVRIQITPRQEELIRSMEIKRQNVVKARVRFAGIAPDGALTFDLLEIVE